MSYHPLLFCQAKVAKDLVKAGSTHRFRVALHCVIYYIKIVKKEVYFMSPVSQAGLALPTETVCSCMPRIVYLHRCLMVGQSHIN